MSKFNRGRNSSNAGTGGRADALYRDIQVQRRAYNARTRESQLDLAALKVKFLRQLEFFLGHGLKVDFLRGVPKERQAETKRFMHEKYRSTLLRPQLQALEAVLASADGESVYFGAHDFTVAELKRALHGNKCRGLYIRFCELHRAPSNISRSQLVSSAKGAVRKATALVAGVFAEQRPASVAAPVVNPLANAELLQQVEKALCDYNARDYKAPEVEDKVRFLQELQRYLTRNGAAPYTVRSFLEQMRMMATVGSDIKGGKTTFEDLLNATAMFVGGQKINFGQKVFNLAQFNQVMRGKVCAGIVQEMEALAQRVVTARSTGPRR